MKKLGWFIVCLGLMACTATQPIEATQVGETAVSHPTLPSTGTPMPSVTPTRISPTPTDAAIILPPPTATPQPTATFLPAPTAETTRLTPIEPVTVGQSLAIPYDLLLMSKVALQLWQPQTGEVTLLLTPTDAQSQLAYWRSAADGQTILIAQTPINEAEPGFRLFLFEAANRQVREVWSDSEAYLLALALAVDGRSAAFITSTTSLRAEAGVKTVQLLDVQTGQKTTLADCPTSRLIANGSTTFTYTTGCTQLVAVPDGKTWLWHDIEGVWQGGLQQISRLLVPHEFFADDPPRLYIPTDEWSLNGRYQLLSGHRGEGSHPWLLDMLTEQTVELPNYAPGLEYWVDWLWTQDNRLLAIRQPIEEGEETNFAELWHIEEGSLVHEKSLTLPTYEWNPVRAFMQLADGRFAFVLNHNDPTKAVSRNLYLMSSLDQPAQPWLSLPPLAGHPGKQSLIWTPDLSGVLYTLPLGNDRLQPFYSFADDLTLYDLTELLGSDIMNFMWLP